ncbi:MAG: thymidylate synthase [Alphaproteobacteria bacterium]|nr:thymidylate synthase [Alphaproteobacteria bacterium]MBU0792634.1 thymidylate synthase [Alphaproteobacteria bacterium]MBU0875785.1 thymidylate synthase [Alphaproteobacteria bacterium]MBU1769024.1 thymidylate synthase [Alphaproteobacteria bacterium]
MTKLDRPDNPEPLMITAKSISEAYSRTLLHILEHPGNEIAPLVLTIEGFGDGYDVPEDPWVRTALDALLGSKKKRDVEDVAHTIFPQRFWTMAQGDRAKLFEFYKMAFPFYRAQNPKANGKGLYFERLMMYGRGPCDGNQLEWILSQYESRPGVRRSMWQATTFDPARDHSATAQLGFPCLQHVSFVPTKAGLVANAFYATQQLFDKAYGNYLGLAQLAAFMAHEMDIPLARLNVTIGVAKLERISKTDSAMKPLIEAARASLAPPAPVAQRPSPPLQLAAQLA